MKNTILCALIALLPASLIAAEQITIQARFIEASRNSPIAHDLARLNQTKGIDLLTAPPATTKLGREAKIEITREFRLGTLPYGAARRIPTGVILTVTPYLHEGQLAYTAKLTVREFARMVPKGPADARKNLTEFTSRELFLSGTSKDGERVWFDFTLPSDGRKGAVCLELTRKDA
jgi:hypothetical protein